MRLAWSKVAPSVPPPRSAYTAGEWSLIRRLSTPALVQRWLESLPYNYEARGETLRSFRGVVRAGAAHCLEGALSAAAILEQHGHPPILLDLESVDDLDHVLFLFRRNRRFGTVAVSRDPGLHGRKPAYRTLRSLVTSYYDPYIDATGRITGYGVLDLRTVADDWRFGRGNLWGVQDALIKMPHRSLPIPMARYHKWKRRYDAFKAQNPDAKPTYYPTKEKWL